MTSFKKEYINSWRRNLHVFRQYILEYLRPGTSNRGGLWLSCHFAGSLEALGWTQNAELHGPLV